MVCWKPKHLTGRHARSDAAVRRKRPLASYVGGLLPENRQAKVAFVSVIASSKAERIARVDKCPCGWGEVYAGAPMHPAHTSVSIQTVC